MVNNFRARFPLPRAGTFDYFINNELKFCNFLVDGKIYHFSRLRSCMVVFSPLLSSDLHLNHSWELLLLSWHHFAQIRLRKLDEKILKQPKIWWIGEQYFCQNLWMTLTRAVARNF